MYAILCFVYPYANEIMSKVCKELLTAFRYKIYWCRNLNKLIIKQQSYPKSRTLDAHEQKEMQCHRPDNNTSLI